MMMIEIGTVMTVAKEGIRGMTIRDILIQIRGGAEKIQTDVVKGHKTVVQETAVMGEKWANQER
jgi:hydrogenase maturation factor